MPLQYRLRRIDFAEIAAKMPDIGVYNAATISPEASLYICALGFEPRCVAMSERLAKEAKRFKRCVILEYETNRTENEINRPQLTKLVSQMSESVHNIDVDAMDFIDRIRSEIRFFAEGSGGKCPQIVLDISVLANRALFRCMRALLEANVHLTILYAEARIYYPTYSQYASEAKSWAADERVGLEQGVSDIRISRDFPGQQLEQLPDCVVVFPSFKAARTNAVLAKVDPALVTNPTKNVIWLVGIPHLDEDNWRIAAMKEINKIDSEKISYEVSTFNYKDTLQQLFGIYDERSAQFNVSVSPLGSKLQALGCVFFCYQRKDVRVIYSIPSRYNASRYSDGCKALWQIEIGKVGEFCALLNQRGELIMEQVQDA